MLRTMLKLWKHFDVLLFLSMAVLIGMGLAIIYSASLPTTSPDDKLLDLPYVRQGISAGLGFVLMLLLASIDYRFLGKLWPLLYVAALGALTGVLFLGDATYGAKRWINFSLFPIQPSEIAKILVILVLGKYLAASRNQLKYPFLPIVSLLIVAIPAALVYLQPDLGTMALFGVIWLSMVIVGGIRPLHLASLFALAVAAIPFAYSNLMRGYMLERLHTFLDPAADPLGAGYNMMQSAYAVGSGGFWGKGFTQGTQSQLHFLRIQKTDFIFSVLAEELGFVGAAVLFTVYVILLLRGVRAASMAPDLYGTVVAGGIVTMILVQVFVNVGVNVRLLPVTGVPLPFISYGGNALIANMGALGILQSIVMRQKMKATEESKRVQLASPLQAIPHE